MDIKDLRIVFMGTPEFAVASLKALHTKGFHIVGAVTAPDKPSGRGLQLKISEVKKYCLENSIPILQPEKLKNEEFIAELRLLNANLFVVVAFRMLPEIIWEMPKLGTINLHASFLPQYRGAAPINWTIINGEKETGLSTFFIDKEIDTGKIIDRIKINITDNETAGELHDKLKLKGADLLVQTIKSITKKEITPIKQSELLFNTEIIKSAPKIKKEDCRIKWDKTNIEIHNLIRGLSPYPGAYTELISPDGKKILLKIFRSEINNESISRNTGEIISGTKNNFTISCKGGSINIIELQLAGKKRMQIDEFLRGFNKISEYSIS